MQFQPLRFVDQSKNDILFLQKLRNRVDDFFVKTHTSKKHNAAMVWKTVVLLTSYILPFLAYLLYNPPLPISILLWAVMAFGVSGIGMAVMHDANHGAYSDNRTINTVLGWTINLAGAFAFNWKIQHNILHHTYTNITHYDDDIDDKAILKLSPHTPVRWYHHYQWIYGFVFYAMMTLYWAFVKDFFQLRRYTVEGLNKNSRTENIILWTKLILIKSIYFFVICCVPSLFFNIPFGKTWICFIVMHLIMGTILTIVFQLAHTIEGTEHPIPSEDLTIESNWAIFQMKTTANFAMSNKFFTWYVGGLNYQIEHHLFPNICHVHYPKISEIVRKTAHEFHIPYLEYRTFGDAFKAHIQALKRFGASPVAIQVMPL